MSTHHPTPDTLAAYANGALPGGARLVVQVHLRACPACRRAVERFEQVGGALLAETLAAPLAPDALQRTLARLEAPPPASAQRLSLDQMLAHGFWIPLGPRLAVKRLSRFADPGERLALLRAAPGQALPEHGHTGTERLAVLHGAFEDDIGVYAAGDLSERGPEDRHQPVARAGETCVCLSATEGPLRLTGLARRLQPLLGL